MRVGTLNVGTMTDKGSRLDAMMERSRVDLFFWGRKPGRRQARPRPLEVDSTMVSKRN